MHDCRKPHNLLIYFSSLPEKSLLKKAVLVSDFVDHNHLKRMAVSEAGEKVEDTKVE